MIKWFEYIPDYYKLSPQMKAIYEALKDQIPDAEDELWKAFFLHLNSPHSRGLWMKELDVKNEAELQAKLQARGMLNKEQTDEQNYLIKEFWREMPEDGLMPSEFGVMADGHEYSPLTSLIYTTPETIENARHLVKMMGMAGFQYFYAVTTKHFAKAAKPEKPQGTRAIYLNGLRPYALDDFISGAKLATVNPINHYSFMEADAQRKTTFSPSILFTDETVFFTDVYAYKEISEVALHYTENVIVQPGDASGQNQVNMEHKVTVEPGSVQQVQEILFSPEQVYTEKKARWSDSLLFTDTDITFLHDTTRTQVSLIKIMQ
ncbi:hypothetical protein [Sporosarcina sp. Marseille-Q4943]|uniref:hypothetical protein n=1 Tax=Sporosarcina sp. Marseille-Q4943 TaxID=2942204 RepID=UPI00208DD1E1|nr:hypothetical protein [Sporosarcina sp. Marseille-Q4943]